MKTLLKLKRAFAWLALVAAMLWNIPAHAQARWKFQFTANIDPMFFDAAIEDPEDVFNGNFQVGSPISGEFSFELPYLNHFEMTLNLNGVPVKMDPVYEAAGLLNLPYFPFELGFFGQGMFLSVSDGLQHPAEFRPPPTGDTWWGQLYFDLYDFTGLVINEVYDVTAFPLGPLPIDDLPLDETTFAGAGAYTVYDQENFPTVHFRMKTAEASIAGGTGLYLWPGRYERFVLDYDTYEVSDDGIDQEVGETDGSTTITIRRIGDLTGTTTVNYTTTDGSALAGVNYTATSGTLTFAPGETEQSFAVDVLDDNVRTTNTTFGVQFSGAGGATPASFATAIRVLEQNPFPYLTVAELGDFETRLWVTNSSGSVTLTLQRNGDLSDPTVVSFQTEAPQTRLGDERIAQPGTDYVSTTGTVTIAAGQESQTITVPLLPGGHGRKVFAVRFTTTFGSLTPRIVVKVIIVNPQPLTVDMTFDPGVGADGDVYDLIPLSNGKIYILGTFTNVGGIERPYIARLNPNGSVDASFNAGRFSHSDQGRGNGLLGLTAPGSSNEAPWAVRREVGAQGKSAPVHLEFGPSVHGEKILGLDNTVSSLIPLPGGRVLIAGNFTSVGGAEQAYLARLLLDGRLDSSFRPQINGPVSRMALQPDGKIVIVGSFSQVNGVPRKNIARLQASGQLDSSFDAGPGPGKYPPYAVAIAPDGKILVGGIADQFGWGGVFGRNLIARLLPDGRVDTTYHQFRLPTGWDSYRVSKIIVNSDGSHLLAGNGNQPILLTRDGDFDNRFRSEIFPNLPPSAMELQPNGKIIISGQFQFAIQSFYDAGLNDLYDFNADRLTLVRLNTDGSIDWSFDPDNFTFKDPLGSPPPTPVRMNEMSIQPDGKILIAGNFTNVSGVPRKGMARIIAP